MEQLLNNCGKVREMLGETLNLITLCFLHEENQKPKYTLLKKDMTE